VTGIKTWSYDWYDGTSSAAPHVAGVAALMLSVNPHLTAAELKRIILDSADTILISPNAGTPFATEPHYVRRLNAYRAVERATRTYVTVDRTISQDCLIKLRPVIIIDNGAELKFDNAWMSYDKPIESIEIRNGRLTLYTSYLITKNVYSKQEDSNINMNHGFIHLIGGSLIVCRGKIDMNMSSIQLSASSHFSLSNNAQLILYDGNISLYNSSGMSINNSIMTLNRGHLSLTSSNLILDNNSVINFRDNSSFWTIGSSTIKGHTSQNLLNINNSTINLSQNTIISSGNPAVRWRGIHITNSRSVDGNNDPRNQIRGNISGIMHIRNDNSIVRISGASNTERTNINGIQGFINLNNAEIHFQHVMVRDLGMSMTVVNSLITANDLNMINTVLGTTGIQLSQSNRANVIENSIIDGFGTGIIAGANSLTFKNSQILNYHFIGFSASSNAGFQKPIISGSSRIKGNGNDAIFASTSATFPVFSAIDIFTPYVENALANNGKQGFIFNTVNVQTDTIHVGHVNVSSQKENRFFPSRAKYSFTSNQLQFIFFKSGIAYIVNNEFENAMNKFKYIIRNYPETEQAKNSMTYLPFLASELKIDVDAVIEYLLAIDHENLILTRDTVIANANKFISRYNEAIDLFEKLIIAQEDNQIEVWMLELSQAFCYMRLQESGSRVTTDASRRRPRDIDEFIALQQEIEDKIHSLLRERPEENKIIPENFEFAVTNFPNPFNPYTTIQFTVGAMSSSPVNFGQGDMSATAHVVINVYNVRGQRVRTLLNEHREPGHHSVVWNGTDDFGRSVSSGIYLYRVVSGENTATRRMLLMK